MKNYGLRKRILNNELTIGSWITIGHHSIIEIMASAKFDWLTIDLEHSVIDLSKAQEMISQIQASRISALVRVSKNEEVVIKRVMDAGANGVIVPSVNSGAEAEQAVAYVKYPPSGRRGVGLTRAQNYGIGFKEYKKWLEKVKKTCLEKNKNMGFHVIPPDYTKLNEKIKEGYRFLAFSLDFLFLGEKAREEMLKINKK